MKEYKFKITEDTAGKRIDAFLSISIPDLSRSRIKKIIKDENISVNNKTIKPKYTVKSGDNICVAIPEAKDMPHLMPQDIKLSIIYEDTDIIIINKPSGMVVHPAAGNLKNTLVNALLFHCKDIAGIGGEKRPGIVHRLDKDTSGIIICAKNDKSHNCLSSQFEERKIKKIYKALVSGNVKKDSFTINTMIGRHKSDRKKISTKTNNGKEAISEFEISKRYENATLLNVKIKTGRTHQIRVHLASIHHPVSGDIIYGGKSDKKVKVKITRLMLHAETLGFFHPSNNEYMEFQVPLPEDFLAVIKSLEKKLSINSNII